MDPNTIDAVRGALCNTDYAHSLRKLLDLKLDPNLQSTEKRSAPLLKYCCNNFGVTQLLIERKADVNAPISNELCCFDPLCISDSSGESSEEEPHVRLTTLSFVHNRDCARILLVAKADPTVDVSGYIHPRDRVTDLLCVAKQFSDRHEQLHLRCRREQARGFLRSGSTLAAFFQTYPGLLRFIGRILMAYYTPENDIEWERKYKHALSI